MCREVFLTVGQRGAGKSTFCERVLEYDSEVVLISRDEVIDELFGLGFLCPKGGTRYAIDVMVQRVSELFESRGTVRLILDAWNGTSEERRHILKLLRRLGADKVYAWYFVTPIDLVARWFWLKPGIVRFSERSGSDDCVAYDDDAPYNDNIVFHSSAGNIDLDGFDSVVRIDPQITTPAEALVV